jgi:hypothetical protein
MTAFKDCTTEDKWVKLEHHLSLGYPVPNAWVLWLLETTGQERMAELQAALFAVRNEICIGPTLDTLWHSSVPAETTVDYICNILQDDWDYDEWLTTHETLKETP